MHQCPTSIPLIFAGLPFRHQPQHAKCLAVERRTCRANDFQVHDTAVFADDERCDHPSLQTLLPCGGRVFQMVCEPQGESTHPTRKFGQALNDPDAQCLLFLLQGLGSQRNDRRIVSRQMSLGS